MTLCAVPAGCVFLQNLTSQDCYALVLSLFEMSLPVLQQPPGEWHPQQQTPGLRLDVTLPFISQAAADKGLATIAKVCVCVCACLPVCGCLPGSACVHACMPSCVCLCACVRVRTVLSVRGVVQARQQRSFSVTNSSGVQRCTHEAAGLKHGCATHTLANGSVAICLACVLCMLLCAAVEQHTLAGGTAPQPG